MPGPFGAKAIVTIWLAASRAAAFSMQHTTVRTTSCPGRAISRPPSMQHREARVSSETAETGVVEPTETGTGSVSPAVDEWDSKYWYHPRIHTWGNIGLGGRLHALCAPLFTHLIDRFSYSGMDVRKHVLGRLPAETTVLDLCCGTGFSTFDGAHGVDTSNEMLDVARLRRPDARFSFGNAETFGDTDGYDVVTVMFATHEMPLAGRRRVLRNALRVARKSVVICDIDPDFQETLQKKPFAGKSFLAGEPYVLDYLAEMDSDVEHAASRKTPGEAPAWAVEREVILKGHVVAWHLRAAPTLDLHAGYDI